MSVGRQQWLSRTASGPSLAGGGKSCGRDGVGARVLSGSRSVAAGLTVDWPSLMLQLLHDSILVRREFRFNPASLTDSAA
jgi:hypothetical protein